MSPLKYRNLITNRRALIEYDKLTQNYLLTHNQTFNTKELIFELLATYRQPWHARFTRSNVSDLDKYLTAISACDDNKALVEQLNKMEISLGSRNQHGHLQSLIHYSKWLVLLCNQADAPLKLNNYFACKNIKARVDAEAKYNGSRMIHTNRSEKQDLFKDLSLKLKALPKSLEKYQQAIKHWRETNRDGEVTTKTLLCTNRSSLFRKEKTRSEVALKVISKPSDNGL